MQRVCHCILLRARFSLIAVIRALLVINPKFHGFSHAAEFSIASYEPMLIETVQELQQKLGISNRIEVAIVEKEYHLVSVVPDPPKGGQFRIRFDKSFLNSLSPSDIRAAVAHELGHVWIFTHHPYLQTENLADQIAVRVVERQDLERLHVKSESFLHPGHERISGKTEAAPPIAP